MAWLVPAAAGPGVLAAPADVVVVVTADPPDVTWTTAGVPVEVAALATWVLVLDWAAVPGRVAAAAPAATRPAAPTARVATRSRARPRWRRTTAERASLVLAPIFAAFLALPRGSVTWESGRRGYVPTP